jgi:hypothetical protein
MEEPIKVTPIGNGRHLVIYAGDDPEERSPVRRYVGSKSSGLLDGGPDRS